MPVQTAPQDRVAQPLVRRSGLSTAWARRPPHRIRLAFFHRRKTRSAATREEALARLDLDAGVEVGC